MAHAVAMATHLGHEGHVDHTQLQASVDQGSMGHDQVDGPVRAASPASLEADYNGTLDQLSKFKCSACAFCSMSAAPAANVVFSEAVQTDDFVAPLIFRTVPVFLTDGPDRPPSLPACPTRSSHSSAWWRGKVARPTSTSAARSACPCSTRCCCHHACTWSTPSNSNSGCAWRAMSS